MGPGLIRRAGVASLGSPVVHRRLLLCLVLLAALAVSCGGGSDPDPAPATEATEATTTVPAAPAEALPAGADLYRPTADPADGPAGSVLWFDESPPIGEARAWTVVGRSTDEAGDPTWATARVFRPTGPASEGGFPLVVWSHGTAGLADACAPSRTGALVPAIQNLLAAGFEVVAPDGAGLGTAGPAEYLVGAAEGRVLLDAARMAQHVPGADAGTEVAIWGYSSGGQGALFAAQEAEAYAPDLTLLGTAAVAPVSDVARFAGVSANFPLTFGYAFLTFGAWSEVYGADLSTIFAPGAMAELPLLEQACAQEIAPHFALTPIDQLRAADPTVTAPWPDLLAENSVPAAATSGPVLLVQGDADPIIAPASTEELAGRLCGAGVDVELRSVPGGRHEVIFPTAPDVVAWFADRSSGAPTASTCTP